MTSTTSTTFEPTLKEQVFEICENLYRNSEKVTRDRVRDVLGGGSFTHISPLVAEWNRLKKEQKLKSTIEAESEAIPLESEIENQVQLQIIPVQELETENQVQGTEAESESEAIPLESEIENQVQIIPVQESGIEQSAEQLNPTETSADFLADDDMEIVVRGGAEKAASLLIAQEAIASHYFQNPDELPQDLKERLKGMRGNFIKARSQAQVTAYDPSKMINLAMAKVKGEKETQKLNAG